MSNVVMVSGSTYGDRNGFRGPPYLPPQAIQDLWRQAVDDPSSLSEEDKCSILEYKPLPEANLLCQTRCGITMSDLFTKAIERPDDLTQDEVDFISEGRKAYPELSERPPEPYPTGIDDALARMWMHIGQPENIRNLRNAAIETVRDSRDQTITMNAHFAQRRLRKSREEKLSHLSTRDQRNIGYFTKFMPWVPTIEGRIEDHWGFVCFRTSFGDNDRWTKYKQQLLRATDLGLFKVPDSGNVAKKWMLQFVEKEGSVLGDANVESLNRYFATLCTLPGAIDPGLRRDVFLFADNATISSSPIGVSPIKGYIHAVDVSYDPSKTYEHDFKGVLKVGIPHLPTTFFNRLLARGEIASEDSPHCYKQSWETMFYKSRYDKEGGVYPPDQQYNG